MVHTVGPITGLVKFWSYKMIGFPHKTHLLGYKHFGRALDTLVYLCASPLTPVSWTLTARSGLWSLGVLAAADCTLTPPFPPRQQKVLIKRKEDVLVYKCIQIPSMKLLKVQSTQFQTFLEKQQQFDYWKTNLKMSLTFSNSSWFLRKKSCFSSTHLESWWIKKQRQLSFNRSYFNNLSCLNS